MGLSGLATHEGLTNSAFDWTDIFVGNIEAGAFQAAHRQVARGKTEIEFVLRRIEGRNDRVFVVQFIKFIPGIISAELVIIAKIVVQADIETFGIHHAFEQTHKPGDGLL